VTSALLLLLGDGRFPAGGHAHSNGAEAACTIAGVEDVAALERYVLGRLRTSGRVDAAFAAAGCLTGHLDGREAREQRWAALDRELTARNASPALRIASRSLGRQALRAGERIWPSPWLAEVRRCHPDGPHQPIALGAVAAAAGLGARDVAAVALHHLVTGWTSAAVRLHGLDPYEVAGLHARLAPRLDRLASGAAESAASGVDDPSTLPATTGLLLDVLAEDHARWDTRLFAS
jgi:urease accessory protein